MHDRLETIDGALQTVKFDEEPFIAVCGRCGIEQKQVYRLLFDNAEAAATVYGAWCYVCIQEFQSAQVVDG